jgi:hypothetical protein
MINSDQQLTGFTFFLLTLKSLLPLMVHLRKKKIGDLAFEQLFPTKFLNVT